MSKTKPFYSLEKKDNRSAGEQLLIGFEQEWPGKKGN